MESIPLRMTFVTIYVLEYNFEADRRLAGLIQTTAVLVRARLVGVRYSA